MDAPDRVAAELRDRWSALVSGLALDPALIDDLLARHGEPQRHYHTAEHVLAVLRHLDALVPSREPGPILAAFFHDAVYDPTNDGSNEEPGSNEEHSAVLAERSLADCSSDLRAQVAGLIRATEGHRLVDVSHAAEFLDADLSILGADADGYDQYAVQIRLEYGHVPDAAYRQGRAAILRGFLERERLFFSAAGRRRWEATAHTNLHREIDTLTKDGV